MITAGIYDRGMGSGSVCAAAIVKPIGAVSLGLLIVAVAVLSPWWRQVPSFLKSAELPGGLKFEFRHEFKSATEEVQQAGLLSEPEPEKKKQPVYEIIYNDDPRLSLAGLRIAIERRLRDLANIAGVPQNAPLSRIATTLEQGQILTHEQANALRDLLPLLNQALHSEEYSKDAADWAISFGPHFLLGWMKGQLQPGPSPISCGAAAFPRPLKPLDAPTSSAPHSRQNN